MRALLLSLIVVAVLGVEGTAPPAFGAAAAATAAPGAAPLPGASGCLYVANLLENTVSIVDTTTDTVVATVPVGTSPDAIALSTDGGRFAYVANYGSNDVSVIDGSVGGVIATIRVGSGPAGITTASPNVPLLWVADKNEHAVAVIDTTTNTVTTKIPVSGSPEGIGIRRNGGTLYVTTTGPGGSGSVVAIDCATNAVMATIPVPARPNRISLSHQGTFAYVTNFGAFSISRFDTTTNGVTGPAIGLTLKPAAISVTPDDRFAYLASVGSFSVTIIRTATDAVVTSIPVGTEPAAIAMQRGSPYTYVANFGSDMVSVIARNRRNTVVDTIAVGHGPFAAALGRYAYCRMATPTPQPTPTPTVGPKCIGDCNADGVVTLPEIMQLIHCFLIGPLDQTGCPDCGVPAGIGVTVPVLVQAVNNLLNGTCGPR